MNRMPLIASILLASSLSWAAEMPAPAGGASAGTPTASASAAAPGAAAPEVYLISPANGAHVHSPVTVRFGLKGMGIAPAGVKFDNTGHHHLLIDTELSQVALETAMPATDKILHFGKGQTETELKLAPGKHTLQLVFADFAHVPIHPAVVSKQISISVAP